MTIKETTMQQQSPTRKPTSSLERASYKPSIRSLGHGFYRVQSASDVNRYYVIDATDNTCTCPAGEHGRQCWHVRQVNEYIDLCAQHVKIEIAAPVAARPSGMAALLEAFGT
jgi:hypothetical protein